MSAHLQASPASFCCALAAYMTIYSHCTNTILYYIVRIIASCWNNSTEVRHAAALLHGVSNRHAATLLHGVSIL